MSINSVQLAMDSSSKTGDENALFRGQVAGPTGILHIGKYYPPHVGGMETHLQYLVSHQSSLLSVEVVVANDRFVTQTEVVDGARITRVASFGTLASQPICPGLPWRMAGRGETMVHLHLPNPWAAQAYLMSGHKGILIVTHHSDTLGRRHLRRFVEPSVRRVMKRAKAIIVTSKRYLENSEELAGFHDKCHIVPLGIDVEAFKAESLEEIRAIRAKYGPRLIVSVGRLVPYKGFEFLLQAMKNIDATLLLIGSGPLREQLEAAVERLGIAAKVHLLGHVGDIVPYYRAAQMLVLPSVSRAESFGMVQLEAMACGIPVVNTELDSGVPEVSLHGVTGITVPPKDPQALSHAIRILLDNAETRANYGQAAAVRVGEKFTARQMAESTLRVYESIL
jgi:glycosyltransferase involved in cell wall biosynthesis